MLANEAPNVVSEEGLRLLLADGYEVQVICMQSAEKKPTQWHGRWVIRALGGEARADAVLVTTRINRGALKAREFKTSLGLISFLVEMGFDIISIPLRAGARVVQMRPALLDPSGSEVEPDPAG